VAKTNELYKFVIVIGFNLLICVWMYILIWKCCKLGV